MYRTTVRLLGGLAVLALVGVSVAASPAAHAGDLITDPAFDFDCDGERDAVDGNQYTAVDDHSSAGSVTVQYAATSAKIAITQATAGIAGSPETGDHFGEFLTAYDDNGDGCHDLVIGAPYEDVADAEGTNRSDSGMVWIVPGSPSGLDVEAAQGFHLDSPGIPGAVATEAYFGRTLEHGTTATGEPYLLIGADGLGSSTGAVYYRRDGVTRVLSQDTPGVTGAGEAGDAFGFRVSAAGDFVAISSIGEQVGEANRAGMVHVFGFDGGDLVQVAALHQDSAGISGTTESGDHFGLGLSVVSYRPAPGDAVRPLVSVGAPDEDLKSAESGRDAGLTHLISIAASGSHRQIYALDEGSPGVPGTVDGNDRFGVDTVLAVRGPSTIGIPATTHWAVAAAEYSDSAEWNYYDAMVFGVTDDPAADAAFIGGDDYGLPIHDNGTLDALDASAGYLYFTTESGADAVYGVDWDNILDGATEPTVVYEVSR